MVGYKTKNMIRFFMLIILAFLLSSCFSYPESKYGDICPACAGSRKCEYCFGLGIVDNNTKCLLCRGSGRCTSCGGRGVV